VLSSLRSLGQAVALAFSTLGLNAQPSPAPVAGWGIDAILSYAVPEDAVPGYLDLLQQSGVTLLRERGVGIGGWSPGVRQARTTYDLARARGFAVAVFAGGGPPGSGTAWGGFPADLRVVWEEGRRQGRDFAASVDAWELHNEPELAWWPDMPDRYGSHAQALYLGLKAGAREAGYDTPVLLGSLGLPAGPWLERTARSGFLAYADAWNVHYYGDSSQFAGFLDGQVQAMRDLLEPAPAGPVRKEAGRWPVRGLRPAPHRPASSSTPTPLPIWATEVGVKTVTPDTWADPERRRRQADWILDTSRQALAHPWMAVFMPFVLVHRNDGYAMTESAEQVWPAWEDYARFTREHPFPTRPTVRPAASVNPVVLQWLADAGTASGHKLASVYRWRAGGEPIRGELRIYNFGPAPVRGRLSQTRELGDGGFVGDGAARPRPVAVAGPDGPLVVPAGGMLTLSLSFDAADAPEGGHREWRQFAFEDEAGRRARLGFALERSPDLYPPEAQPLELGEWGAAEPIWRHVPQAEPSDARRGWRAINGVKVVHAAGTQARFALGARPFDPEFPSMAAAYLPAGLPETGWLRVAVRELGPAGVRMRVDLVDAEGRRFTQWENLGQVNGLPVSAPRWLNLVDFHPYAWGKLDTRRRLRPSEVREVQLRFYANQGPTMVDVGLGFAREYGERLDPAGEVKRGGTGGAASAPVE
jgi:hypothetical protein